MPQTEEWTIGRLLAWTTKYLKERGADSPRLDAELLLAEACGRKRIELYTSFEETPPDAVRTAFRELVRRRAEGAPVAYLLGRREFYSLSFRVTGDVLIPRPETEFLLIRLLDLARKREVEAPVEIVDVGAGSGILAICAAKELPRARVTAVDISPAALAVARANATDHGMTERIAFIEGDLLGGLPDEQRFDFVVSNPPYITTAEMATLAVDVAKHEPRLALEAGPRGTEIMERLIPEAAARLRPGGWLLMEISPQLATTVTDLIASDGRFEPATISKDLAGLARVAQARRRSNTDEPSAVAAD
ncbi:MAG: peptide chain release factor N(5)-glutamine methyltransferase [Pirellulales bacterium]|nr:peptide chain release factor N(5)-glutamine methyltransferase [Pirellulales bacterium]